jgi:DNA-binding LacI/PurR family transcriptional regulator
VYFEQKHYLEIGEEWSQLSTLDGIAGGKEGIVKILAQQHKPTAVFACNGLTAVGQLMPSAKWTSVSLMT